MSSKSPSPKKRKARKSRKSRDTFSSVTLKEAIVSLVAVGAAAGAVAWSRADVAGKYQQLGVESPVYAIPQGDQLKVFSLGYRSAMADLLFGRTLVSAGVHFSEKRVFHHLDAYLKGIIALDPKYLDVYKLADSLLNLSTVEMPKENLRIARDIQEQGLEEFPHDAELWISVGQFIGYMAPQRLPETEDKKEWRIAGARIIQHACEIWPEHDALPQACSGSTALLLRYGETETAIEALKLQIAITDDEELREKASKKLRLLTNQRNVRVMEQKLQGTETLRKSDLPYVSSLRYQLLSPPFDAEKCRGARDFAARTECATSFAALREILSRRSD